MFEDITFWQLMLLVTIIGVVLTIIAVLYVFLPIEMAYRQGRSRSLVLILFWLATPILATIILLFMGDTPNKNTYIE